MSSSLLPDLQVLCRKLTTIPPAQLLHSLPTLVNHALRCKVPLSAPHEQKLKDGAPESSLLVHKLKTSITTLINGRNSAARFAAIGLIKTVVDVGGWETLRSSEPWVRGLLAVVQKNDAIAAKELAIVALTKIYTLVHPYQTLVREIATPTIPAFVTSCLSLLETTLDTSEQTLPCPESVVETVCDSLSALIPLYPTTFRPFSSRIKSAMRPFLAPTISSPIFIPRSLRRPAARLVARLHFVAAKSGGGDEWAKAVDGLLKELHATADQVFRAVNESRDDVSGHSRSQVDPGEDPHGGGESMDELPPWSGIQAGAERLVGLCHYLSECLRSSTKAAVAVPISSLMETVSRLCMVARLSPKTQTWDQSLQTNSAIGREEKEELWSLMPDIHVATLDLVLIMLQRFGEDLVAVVSDILDHLVRVFKSGIDIPLIRESGYTVLSVVLLRAGPTLSKSVVDMLDPLIGACCRDLQEDAGYLKPGDKANASAKGAMKSGVAANADLFLQPQVSSDATMPVLDPEHKAAASELLTTMLSSLPQRHLKPSLRGLMDQTAIVTRNRDAMLSSVLYPYKDQRGRMYPNILPHLSRQYPQDQGLEVLRTNLRTGSAPVDSELLTSFQEAQEQDGEDVEDEEMQEQEIKKSEPTIEARTHVLEAETLAAAPQNDESLATAKASFWPQREGHTVSDAVVGVPLRAVSPPKRKNEELDAVVTKRQELERPEEAEELFEAPPLPAASQNVDEGDDDDDSDESVHLNMELEDDDDHDEEDD